MGLWDSGGGGGDLAEGFNLRSTSPFPLPGERRGRPRKKRERERERECEIERLGCRAELYRERRVWDAGGPENRIVQLEDAPRENVGVLLGGTAAASGR